MRGEPMLKAGSEIDGRFVVEALIGQGGLAEVYRVRHVELGSLHALKLLVWKKKQLEERLILEGRIQAQLRHPNVVAVTDLVRHDGQVGLLMEYVDHESLEDYVARAAPVPVADALPLFAAILAGVTAAHDAGVLHRDLKPANVMLARSSSGVLPKVADFGIAKVVQEMQGGRTAAGVTMGTPGYLAPEQILDSADADVRADVFALGAILYEMLTGRRAFADEAGEVSVRSTLEGEVVPLDTLCEDLDVHLVEAVHCALSREREARFEDVRAFARALFPDRPELLAQVTGQHVGGPISIEAGPQTRQPRTESVETFLPEAAPPPPPTTAPGARQSAGLLLVGAGVGGLLALVAGLGLVAALSGPGEAPPEPVPGTAAAAPDPVPGTATAPDPVPGTATAPDPVPGTATAPDPVPGTAEVAPVPEPAPKPLAIADTGALIGTWSGSANGRPLELRIDAVRGGALSGELTFYQGPTARTLPAEGRVDAETGAVSITGGAFQLRGKAAGATMSGTYMAGKKSLPWSLVKGG